MVKRVIVLELKDDYALAMEEGGGIIRIQRKNGLSVGDKIYVLPEDIFQQEQTAAVTPFSNAISRKRPPIKHTFKENTWVRLVGLAAMLAIVITLFLPQMSLTAYALASFDGSTGIQIELSRQGQILDVFSPDHSIPEEALSSLKSKNIKDVKMEIYTLCDSGSILIGYAPLNGSQDEDTLAQTIQSLFQGQPVVYLYGNTNDIHAAKRESLSLGKYLIEQTDDDELEEVLSSLPDEKLEQLLQEKPKWINEKLRETLEEDSEDLDDDNENIDDSEEPDSTETLELQEEPEEMEEPEEPDSEEPQDEISKSNKPDLSQENEDISENPEVSTEDDDDRD